MWACCCGLDVIIIFLNYDIKNLIVIPTATNPHSGDSGTRATLAELDLQNDAEATPALGLLGLSLSYEMMEGLLLFKF